MVYTIFFRYEHWTKNGQEFTEFFKFDNEYNTEEEVKNRIKELKEFTKQTDKVTKCKHEYKYEYVDETLFLQAKMKRPKGRPKKFINEDLDGYIKTLNKKGQVKVEEKDKEFLYNDEEAKKYIQDNIKDKSKWTRYWYDNDNVLYIILKNNSDKIYE